MEIIGIALVLWVLWGVAGWLSGDDKTTFTWTTDTPKEANKFYAVCIVRDDGSKEYSFAKTSFDYYGKNEFCFYVIGDEVPRKIEEYKQVYWMSVLLRELS